jgi:oligosaccharide repeat unit polymerase
VYYAIGVVPILSDDPATRYLGPDITTQSALYNSLFRRGVDLITVASPILLLGWLKNRKSIWILFAAGLGFLVLTASARRGPLVFTVICVFLVYALFGLRLRVLILGVCFSLAILLVLQFAVLGGLARTGPNSLAIDAAITYGEVFGEVREFAWLISEWDGKYLEGRTLAAALLPVPSTMSSFKNRNLMSSVSKEVVGIPEDAPHGGLRILIFGEAYLNFGYPGAVLVGLLFGLALATGDRFFWEIRASMGKYALSKVAILPCVYLYCVLCYEIYLGGSVSLADSVLGIATLAFVYAMGAWKQSHAPLSHKGAIAAY